jgi:hypothetical protein
MYRQKEIGLYFQDHLGPFEGSPSELQVSNASLWDRVKSLRITNVD